MESIRSFVIPITSLDAQRKIVEIIERLIAFSAVLQKEAERSLKVLEGLRASILNQAFSGSWK